MAVTAVVGASVVSAGAGVYSANKQAKTAKAARKAGDKVFERQEFYNEQLQSLMLNPQQIFTDPGYEQTFNQGIEAVERSSAARGFTGSGNAAVALQSYGQSFALDYLNKREQLLAGLSGANAASSPAQLYGTAGQIQSDANQQLGDSLSSLGYSFANFGGASAGTPASGGGTTYGGGGSFVGPR